MLTNCNSNIYTRRL